MAELLYMLTFGGDASSSLDILSTAVANLPPLLHVNPERLQFDAVFMQDLPGEIVGGFGGGLQCLTYSSLLSPSTGTTSTASRVIDNCNWNDRVSSLKVICVFKHVYMLLPVHSTMAELDEPRLIMSLEDCLYIAQTFLVVKVRIIAVSVDDVDDIVVRI
eukprot:9375049-Ditylum_brightwellii.AAC.1